MNIKVIKNILNQLNLKYEISDCTLPEELLKILHIEFYDVLSEKDILEINNLIDDYYKKEYKSIENSVLPIIDIESMNEIYIERSSEDYENAEKT